MSWVTVYIKGRTNFRKEVLVRLERTWLSGNHEAGNDLLMFWIEDPSRIRSLKLAVGSKLIFKYRLHFFTDLDSHLKSEKRESAELTAVETEMAAKVLQFQTELRSAPRRQKRNTFLQKIK